MPPPCRTDGLCDITERAWRQTIRRHAAKPALVSKAQEFEALSNCPENSETNGANRVEEHRHRLRRDFLEAAAVEDQ